MIAFVIMRRNGHGMLFASDLDAACVRASELWPEYVWCGGCKQRVSIVEQVREATAGEVDWWTRMGGAVIPDERGPSGPVVQQMRARA